MATIGVSKIRDIHVDILEGGKRFDVVLRLQPFGRGFADAVFQGVDRRIVFAMLSWVRRHSYPYGGLDGYTVPSAYGWSWKRLVGDDIDYALSKLELLKGTREVSHGREERG